MGQPTRCDECGAMMEMGSWPFCGGDPSKHEVVRNCHMGEEPLEPYWDENLGPDPILITTRGQRRKIMEEQGLYYKTTDARRRQAGKKLYFT